MKRRGLVMQTPHPATRWMPYHLTEAGRMTAGNIGLAPSLRRDIAAIAHWAAGQGFTSLLNKVYAEAPDFATRSVLRQGGQPA